MVSAFEGGTESAKTMPPIIDEFMVAHRLPEVTVVADTGMISGANQTASGPPGRRSSWGWRFPSLPPGHPVVPRAPGRERHGYVFTQQLPAERPSTKSTTNQLRTNCRSQVTFKQPVSLPEIGKVAGFRQTSKPKRGCPLDGSYQTPSLPYG